MRGLGHLQCLFLQHNLIEVIASNAFWECPSLSSIDLSSNKLARIDPSTFTILSRLMVCELAANPFHCGCDLYSFLIWLESFNNVTHTYDRLQCETPREMFGYPLLVAAGHAGRNAKNILYHHCRDGVMIPGMTSLPPDLDGPSGIGPEVFGGLGPYHQPTTSSSSTEHSFIPSIKLHHVSLSSASLLVQIPRPYLKMYILTQYNYTYVSDVMNLRNKKEMITLNKLKPHTNYTFCVASFRNSQRYNHTCLQFSTRAQDTFSTPSTMTHYIMTIVGCLFGMLIILGFVYYCLRKKRVHNEKRKSICVKKTILEMRYGPEVAAAVSNDPAAVHKLQEQSREQHQYQHHHGGKLPMSTSSSSGMLHSANTSSSRLSSIPQVEKMGTAFSEAMGTKGNYMDVRSGMERVGDGGHAGRRGLDLRDDDATDVCDDSDDDGRGSASEISTIAMEVDKVNQIINNCIDALKLDAAAVATSGASSNPIASSNPTSPPPNSTSSLTRGLIPLSQGLTETGHIITPNKIPVPPPLPALNAPLSERPGISGGGFVVSPPYRPPPPATAVRPIQRQMSADNAIVNVNAVKKQGSTTSCGSMGQDRERGGARVYSLDVPEPRSPDACNQKQQQFPDRASPVGCGEPLERLPLVGSGTCGGGGGGGCDSGGVGAQHQENQKPYHYHQQQQIQQQQQLKMQQDYHCSEHRHSVPALYYEGSHQGSPAQRVSFLKPLTRSRRDAASYSQLSPARHHSSNSGYSSSPEYSSESTLRIWERFRPYRKGQRDESCYVTAGNALRKKVQFAKGEDLHDILDYWKGVSAQQKL